MISKSSISVMFRRTVLAIALVFICWSFYRCGSEGGYSQPVIIVNSLLDIPDPPEGVVTLRKAIGEIPSGGRVAFDESLNGGTILLEIVGEEHSILRSETFSGPNFLGYLERDFGKSAIYARKDLTIDADDLPDGIIIKWGGGETNPARVLAIYGDLIMNNVTISSGFSKAEELSGGDQPFTLASGGGLAIWGKAVLNNCVFSGNRIEGDNNASRDRGAFGGGIFGNLLIFNDCIVSGNQAKGYGAAGGGIYSLGGVEMPGDSSIISRSAITGNRVTGHHAYGGGVFTAGGGRGGRNWLMVENCTIARNLVEERTDNRPSQYYYRGGGVYMTNGSLSVKSSTIVENVVTGELAFFKGKPNVSGGGIAATIGDAHVVEYMEITHSIIVGNQVNSNAEDVYTGSLLHFNSFGYNLLGKINFNEILVPIPVWWSVSRKHYPKEGDIDGVDLSEVVNLGGVAKHPEIISAGIDDGENVVLWYPPEGDAVDRIPSFTYYVSHIKAQYEVSRGGEDDFLCQVLEKLRTDFEMGPGFGSGLICEGVTWQGEVGTWPSDPGNADWIKFWRDLDQEIGDALGTVKLGDNFWGAFDRGPLGDNLYFYKRTYKDRGELISTDQLGTPRPQGIKGDIGAIERD